MASGMLKKLRMLMHSGVSGRGELHLSVLIENMRREGSLKWRFPRPKVIFREIDGQTRAVRKRNAGR